MTLNTDKHAARMADSTANRRSTAHWAVRRAEMSPLSSAARSVACADAAAEAGAGSLREEIGAMRWSGPHRSAKNAALSPQRATRGGCMHSRLSGYVHASASTRSRQRGDLRAQIAALRLRQPLPRGVAASRLSIPATQVVGGD